MRNRGATSRKNWRARDMTADFARSGAYIHGGYVTCSAMDSILYRRERSLWDHLFDYPLLFLGTELYRFTQPRIGNLKPRHTSIRIICLSDTHNDHGSTSPL